MSVRLTNEARAGLRANLKAAIHAAGDSETITPAMINVAQKADLLIWAARYGVTVAPSTSLAIDSDIETDLEAHGIEADKADKAEPAPAPEPATEADDIEAAAQRDVAELQAHISVMDGAAFKAKALDIARRAHKPAEIITLDAPSSDGSAPVRPRARVTGKDTLKNLFGVTGALGRHQVELWSGGADVPARDPHYVWAEDTGTILAAALVRGRNVFLCGPAGTGKTSFAEQVASRLGRPFFRISFHGQLEAAEVMGQRIITPDAGMVWADGILPLAMQVPGAIILLDEIDRARSGMVTALQPALDSRKITFPETGHTIKAAPGVVFMFAGNTNGTGDATGQYTAAQQLDRATLDRAAMTIMVDYLPSEKEAALLVAKTECPRTLADLLVHFAGVTRLDVSKGELPHGVGFRRLFALAEILTLGAEPDAAIKGAILNTVGPDEVEKLSLLLKTHLSATVVRRAMKGEQVLGAGAAVPGRGAQDFEPVAE